MVENSPSAVMFAQFCPVLGEASDQLCLVWSPWVVYLFWRLSLYDVQGVCM